MMIDRTETTVAGAVQNGSKADPRAFQPRLDVATKVSVVVVCVKPR